MQAFDLISTSNEISGGAECNNVCNEQGRNCIAPFNTPCSADAYQCTAGTGYINTSHKIDVCDGGGSCSHQLRDGQACNDGNACTSNDV